MTGVRHPWQGFRSSVNLEVGSRADLDNPLLRLVLLAQSRVRANCHASWEKGELSRLMTTVSKTTGELRPMPSGNVMRLIRQGVEMGLFTSQSSTRCIVLASNYLATALPYNGEHIPCLAKHADCLKEASLRNTNRSPLNKNQEENSSDQAIYPETGSPGSLLGLPREPVGATGSPVSLLATGSPVSLFEGAEVEGETGSDKEERSETGSPVSLLERVEAEAPEPDDDEDDEMARELAALIAMTKEVAARLEDPDWRPRRVYDDEEDVA